MYERVSGLKAGARQGRGKPGIAARCLAAAVLLAALAACEHGVVSYNRSTGTFGMPLGSGSSRGGQN